MSAPSLLERERELAAIEGGLDEAVAGRGGLMAIEGPAGIGKSALVERARAAALAAPVVLPETAPAGGEDGSAFATLHGLYWLVAGLAEERPQLLAVDDVHWADEASVRFLLFLIVGIGFYDSAGELAESEAVLAEIYASGRERLPESLRDALSMEPESVGTYEVAHRD